MSTIVAADAGSYDVHLGFWINWSYGRTQGATITLSRQSGGLLIAFLALFHILQSDLTGWALSSAAGDTPKHGVGPPSFCQSTHSRFAWRKPRFPFKRILPLALVALLLAGSFAISGIFSSRVTTDNANEVLLSGKKCGIFSNQPVSQNMSLAVVQQYLSQRTTAFLDRSLQCYSNSQALKSENCKPYIKPTLPYTITSNASCPFDESMCLTKNNLRLDTGLLNSHEDLGLNAPPKNRFHFRNVVQCAPLVTGGFSKVHINSVDPKIPLMRYYYGAEQAEVMQANVETSFTYQVPVNFSTVSLDNFTSVQSFDPDYMVGAVYTSPITQQTIHLFEPLPQLNRTDAVLWLIFLSAPGVAFLNPTDDPWFSAHMNTSATLTDPFTGKAKPLLAADDPARVLGCTTQTQFCTSNASRCEPLDASDATYNTPVSHLWADSSDQSAMTWAKNALLQSFSPQIGDFFAELGVSPLLARFQLANGLQLGNLPPNQWQLEIEHLFQAQLVSFQDAFVSAASGPFSPEMEPNYILPNTSSQTGMCQNQKIYSALYYSFNVLGLSLILVIGTIIIALDLSIESIVSYIDKTRKHPRHTHSRLEWHANSTLQLQRLAHEELGLGTWRGCTDEVPVTEHGEHLGLLDISDENHPKLMRPVVDEQATVSEGSIHSKEKAKVKTIECESPQSEGSASPTSREHRIESMENKTTQGRD